MANVSVTYTFSPNTSAASGEVNTNFADLVSFINNRNTGATSWTKVTTTSDVTCGGALAVTGNSVLTGTLLVNSLTTLSGGLAAVTIPNTTNQLVLGATRTVTITAPTPASASRTVTFPDLGADYSVVGTAGTQAAIAGVKTFTGQLIGKGTATNDSAAAGYIGEAIRSGVSSPSQVEAVNNQFKDITTIDLTAGDWDVSGVVEFNLDAGSLSTNQMQAVISAYANNTTTDHSNGSNLVYAVSSGGGVFYAAAIPPIRITIASPTTIHLKGLLAFSGGPPHLFGFINARRVR